MAIHQAIGRYAASDMALAGGVNADQPGDDDRDLALGCYTRVGETFDATAGRRPWRGCVLVLKRRATRGTADRIRAVIRGSAVTRTARPADDVPNGRAQQRVIADAPSQADRSGKLSYLKRTAPARRLGIRSKSRLRRR